MEIQQILEVLLMISLPTALVLGGLISRQKVKEPWWSKLLIVMGITLLILIFLVWLQA